MKRRVVQFSTGNVGRHALRAILQHPHLELVGLNANAPDKVGRSAAELAGLDVPTDVVATDDLAALVALGADCCVYTAQAETRPEEALAEMTAFLAAGTNVVATSLVWLVYPEHADEWLLTPLREACAAGGSTLYVNGVDPGFSGDLLPLAALSLAESAERVTVSEICEYGSYPDGEFTGASFGFGKPPEYVPTLFLDGVLTSIWGGPARLLADELGVEIEGFEEYVEKWVAPETFDCAMGHIEAGTVSAVRFSVAALVGGERRIVMEHVNRLLASDAPEWPRPPEGRPGVHRVVVTGVPGIEINAHLGLDGVDHNDAGVVATAAKVVNAIEVVCDHAPGLVSLRDLPVSQVAGLMR